MIARPEPGDVRAARRLFFSPDIANMAKSPVDVLSGEAWR